jgi:hypothetical protein
MVDEGHCVASCYPLRVISSANHILRPHAEVLWPKGKASKHPPRTLRSRPATLVLRGPCGAPQDEGCYRCSLSACHSIIAAGQTIAVSPISPLRGDAWQGRGHEPLAPPSPIIPLKNPIMVRVVLEPPLAHRTRHDIEIIHLIAIGRAAGVMPLGHQHHIAI